MAMATATQKQRWWREGGRGGRGRPVVVGQAVGRQGLLKGMASTITQRQAAVLTGPLRTALPYEMSGQSGSPESVTRKESRNLWSMPVSDWELVCVGAVPTAGSPK